MGQGVCWSAGRPLSRYWESNIGSTRSGKSRFALHPVMGNPISLPGLDLMRIAVLMLLGSGSDAGRP